VTPAQIALITAGIKGLFDLGMKLAEMLEGEEIPPEERAEIRARHRAAVERLDELARVPEPPAG